MHEAICRLRGVLPLPEPVSPARDGSPSSNAHIHLPPNFSAFESLEQAVDLAAAQGVRVLGASNYYDYSMYGRFAARALAHGVYPVFGLEIIALLPQLRDAGILVNDPGNPGKIYLCGKGITRFEEMTLAGGAIPARADPGAGRGPHPGSRGAGVAVFPGRGRARRTRRRCDHRPRGPPARGEARDSLSCRSATWPRRSRRSCSASSPSARRAAALGRILGALSKAAPERSRAGPERVPGAPDEDGETGLRGRVFRFDGGGLPARAGARRHPVLPHVGRRRSPDLRLRGPAAEADRYPVLETGSTVRSSSRCATSPSCSSATCAPSVRPVSW